MVRSLDTAGVGSLSRHGVSALLSTRVLHTIYSVSQAPVCPIFIEVPIQAIALTVASTLATVPGYTVHGWWRQPVVGLHGGAVAASAKKCTGTQALVY
jgi:hypothetical protein